MFAAQLQLEKDKLCEAFSESAEEVQRNADMTHVVLEKKLRALKESLEKTEAQLSAVLSASNTDQTALSGITKKIEVVFYNLLLALLQQSSTTSRSDVINILSLTPL